MPLEVVDLIDRLLSLNPYERLAAGPQGSDNDFEALKNHKLFEGINFEKMKQGEVAPPIPRDLIENFERLKNEKSKLVGLNLFADVIHQPQENANTKEHWLGTGFKDNDTDLSTVNTNQTSSTFYQSKKNEESKANDIDSNFELEAKKKSTQV